MTSHIVQSCREIYKRRFKKFIEKCKLPIVIMRITNQNVGRYEAKRRRKFHRVAIGF